MADDEGAIGDGLPSAYAKRNQLVANDFSVARGIWNLHDAIGTRLDVLIAEQRHTNELLRWIGDLLKVQSPPGP
jgi:hypothetical protein